MLRASALYRPCGVGSPQGYKKPNDQMVNELIFDILDLP